MIHAINLQKLLVITVQPDYFNIMCRRQGRAFAITGQHVKRKYGHAIAGLKEIYPHP
jgi:adenylyl- and sulfurtransferase ThiI